MKKIGFVLLTFILMTSTARARETSYHTRLLLHGHRTIGSSDFGVAGWVLAPDITSTPSTCLAIAGLWYNNDGWNLELMTGAIMKDGDAGTVIDLRVELTPELWDVPLYSWHNPQWIGTGGAGALYWYSQIDYTLPLNIGMVGIETENTFGLEDNSIDASIGPHAFIPLSDHLVLVAAPQFHFDKEGEYTGFQFWIRGVLNL